MKTQILCTLWGMEDLPFEDSFLKVKQAGYDGVDAWIPEDTAERKKFIRLLDEYQFPIVCHQHQAADRRRRSSPSAIQRVAEFLRWRS